MRKMYADLRDGKLQENEIDETHFEAYLDTKDIPDPDLLIRTSGEQPYRIISYGAWLTVNFILRKFHGRTSIKKN